MKAKELFTRKILAQFTCQSVKLDWVEEKKMYNCPLKIV